ncbi:Retrovirus-related Pol polyprotein from transposon 297 family [Gossypium australe]|uniref:Retrovirus-related Pol polyprotein from transposon 297 family n=1 Tax=Gossypium australe TaxID=47621 RepID=A0A5B6UFW1_9ROSI|nr:Retrovirus-related Pol polyprotein from transposon 297 family [Gossypium australe]
MGPLKETGVIIQLVDCSNVYPTGVLEDVLVQVNRLFFSCSFYVLDMEEEDSSNPNLILLRWSFFRTSKTIINVHDGTLTMEFDGEVINLTFIMPCNILVTHAPKLELNPLSDHLKCAFLGHEETLPEAIGWTIVEIKGFHSSMCIHRILMKKECKPLQQAQCRLNPPMMEVVKKEIMKLLDVKIIYLISDSKWVSLIQLVPKKIGITVIENYDGDMVLTRVQNEWRVCIGYRNLNALTRKDHFPLSFIDQILERLAGMSHYYCLDGYSGFHQILVASKDKEKTTFTCPLAHSHTDACHSNYETCFPYSKGAWLVFSLIMLKTSLRFLWMILQFMVILSMYV